MNIYILVFFFSFIVKKLSKEILNNFAKTFSNFVYSTVHLLRHRFLMKKNNFLSVSFAIPNIYKI